MVMVVVAYLETAAATKRDIKRRTWMGFGLFRMTNDTRVAVYWSLAMIVFGLMAVYAWLQEFLGSVKKEKGGVLVRHRDQGG